MEPHVVPPGEGEAVADRPERTVRILVGHELADVTWSRYEAGQRGPAPHVHHEHADAFYVLEGELEFGIGPRVEPVRAPAGTWVLAPPGLVHTFANESAERALFLNVHAPSCGFAGFLRTGAAWDSHDPPAHGGLDASEAVVVPPGGGERFDRGNRQLAILSQTPQLAFLDVRFGPGWDGIDPHLHDDHLDAFWVLEGEVAFTAGERTHVGGPGTFVAAQPGARHGFAARSDRIRLLNLHAPDTGFADRVRSG